MRWYEVTITGQDAHTGATPMHLRKNALLGSARLVDAIDAIGRKHPPGVATVGRIENRPNSPNVVPGEVFFMVDMRHPDGRALDAMEQDLRAALPATCGPLGLQFTEQRIWDQPAVVFNADCVAAVRQSAKTTGYSARDIVSGAGHDAAYVSRVAPAAMIFVPCLGGISHNEAEFSSKEQCAKGAQVLLQAVLDYDRQLAERGKGART
jgi:N-carbamoyl-L-amino-acid hydrolase